MKKWWPLVAVSLGTFMLLVDVTIVNVALPAMARNLSTSFSSLQWVVDVYALVLAALVLAAGTVSDLLGHRRVYLWGLALFAAASLVSGLAPNAGMLIVARGVQGLGGAAMFATTFALLNQSYQGRDRGVAYGAWGAVGGASAALGPIVGGLLTQHLSWRWIFFVNVPVSIATIVLCLAVLRVEHHRGSSRLDVPGLVSFVVAATGVTYGLIRGGNEGWGDALTLTSFAVSAVALAVFVAIEARSDHPMVDLALLRDAPFVGVLIAGVVLNFSAFAYLAYTSIWLQSVLGYGAVKAGLATLALSIAAFLVAGVGGRLLHGRPPGPVIGGGLALIGLGALIEALQLGPSSGWPALTIGLVVAGVGVGMATPVLSSTAMAAVPLHRGGMAAGMVNTCRQLGFALGIAALGAIFSARVGHVLSDHVGARGAQLAGAVTGGQSQAVLARVPSAARAQVSDAIHAATVSGLDAILYVSAAAGILAGLVVVVLVRRPQAGRHEAESSATSRPAQVAASVD